MSGSLLKNKFQNDVQHSGLTRLLADHKSTQCLLVVTGLNVAAARRPKMSSFLSCQTQQTKLGGGGGFLFF